MNFSTVAPLRNPKTNYDDYYYDFSINHCYRGRCPRANGKYANALIVFSLLLAAFRLSFTHCCFCVAYEHWAATAAELVVSAEAPQRFVLLCPQSMITLFSPLHFVPLPPLCIASTLSHTHTHNNNYVWESVRYGASFIHTVQANYIYTLHIHIEKHWGREYKLNVLSDFCCCCCYTISLWVRRTGETV